MNRMQKGNTLLWSVAMAILLWSMVHAGTFGRVGMEKGMQWGQGEGLTVAVGGLHPTF